MRVFYAREFSRARSINDLKTFFFWCKKQPVLVSFFSANKSEKKDARLIDDEGFYLRKGRRENVVISLSLSLSLSLRRKSSREKEEEHALQILLTKRALVSSKRRASKAPRFGRKSLCKMSKGQNEMREFRQKP